ncbi:hypothetical protein [Streptomyces sp. NPDC058665]|uniref:hypothetical protein n=1 Tax=Streptomyces sp. NPDC058665 TaxID=3346586 RepID=UPI00365E6C9A
MRANTRTSFAVAIFSGVLAATVRGKAQLAWPVTGEHSCLPRHAAASGEGPA